MVKYRIFQIIMAVAVTLLILSSAVCMAFAARDVSESKYKPKQVEEIEMTEYEAWLEYSIIADGFDSGNKAGFENGNVVLCEYNLARLDQINTTLKKARATIFFAIVLLVIGFLVVKKRRLYECIVWGGAASLVISAASLLLLLSSKTGFFFSLKEMIFHDTYSALFSEQDLLTCLIPEGLGMRMFLVYVGTIMVGLAVTIIVRLISWRKAQPHKF